MTDDANGIGYREIYDSQASKYDRLVSREDHEGNLLPALNRLLPLSGISVVELGAGTGRLTRLLSPHVSSIKALDRSLHMLEYLWKSIQGSQPTNFTLIQADNRALPLVGNRADLVLAGWTISHLVGWHPKDWTVHTDAVLEGMQRVVKPGGTIIVLETLGTGRESPLPPTDRLAAFYNHLEDRQGFSSTWIRTDYRFNSFEEAVELTKFFFGQALADRVAARRWQELPECTGIWWKRC